MGTSGNSDPHYGKDWQEITVDTTLDRFADSSDASNDAYVGKSYCTFPSTRIVEVFYEKINTKEDPQHLVKKM